jgi:hypothetical protein
VLPVTNHPNHEAAVTDLSSSLFCLVQIVFGATKAPKITWTKRNNVLERSVMAAS